MEMNHFREKLAAERHRLEEELKKMAKPNPHQKGVWDPQMPNLNVETSDTNEMSDVFEEMDNVIGIEYQLEQQLKEVNGALERIEKGAYGFCEIDNKPIDPERLEANPAASTCVKHAGQ